MRRLCACVLACRCVGMKQRRIHNSFLAAVSTCKQRSYSMLATKGTDWVAALAGCLADDELAESSFQRTRWTPHISKQSQLHTKQQPLCAVAIIQCYRQFAAVLHELDINGIWTIFCLRESTFGRTRNGESDVRWKMQHEIVVGLLNGGRVID